MSYYQVPDHTHIADVSLQRSDRGYAVTAAFVTVPERAIDEPYTDTRTWHVESSNLWRDLGSAGWAMDHYDRLVDGHRIHAEPSVGSTLPLPEMLAVAANRAQACASDSERQAYNDVVELRTQLREYTHPHTAHPEPALQLAGNEHLPEQQHLGADQRPALQHYEQHPEPVHYNQLPDTPHRDNGPERPAHHRGIER